MNGCHQASKHPKWHLKTVVYKKKEPSENITVSELNVLD